MATVDLTTKFLPKTDEQFAAESKRSLVTNQNFTWDGAATVRVYKVSTGKMNNYARNGDPATGSRFGEVEQLNATTYPLTIEKDRSFTFVIDKLDEDETQQQLSGATALARQNREVVIPEVDAYTYGVMCTNAGTKPAAVELTAENIYDEICKAGALMDEAGVPETGRVLVVTPEIQTNGRDHPLISFHADHIKDLKKAMKSSSDSARDIAAASFLVGGSSSLLSSTTKSGKTFSVMSACSS